MIKFGLYKIKVLNLSFIIFDFGWLIRPLLYRGGFFMPKC